MEESLFKLELGCGRNKTDGYIGIDRFNLPGVDIVADLNNTVPINENTADVIYACHSLEHFDNIEFVINEIYRIGKHKCIVQILAPYYYTTLNLANFYHKNIFNEDTFRFFTMALDTDAIDKEDWYCPHAETWGLSESDNSKHSVQLELINMEFFYYKQYLGFTQEQKRRARRSLNNVCDQIYYELVINKSGMPFAKEEIKELQVKANQLEPPIIQQLRNRDENTNDAISIYDDINKDLNTKINRLEKLFVDDSSSKQKQIKHIIVDYENKINAQSLLIDSLKSKLDYTKCQNDKISAIVVDLYKINDSRFNKKIKLFKKSNDMFNSLYSKHRNFIDRIVLNCNKFKNSSILSFSKIVPYDNYFQYEVSGDGSSINFFTISSVGATLFVEIISNSKIIKQDYLVLMDEGEQKIKLDTKISGKVFVRFKTIDNTSFIKILEIVNRKGAIFIKRNLASFISVENKA